VADHENTILMLKKSNKSFPMGRFTPKTNIKKNPTTVGGKTSGMVNRPSKMAFILLDFKLTTARAAINPRKKVMTIESEAVLKEMSNGCRFNLYSPIQ
jgi:hypothetical protein